MTQTPRAAFDLDMALNAAGLVSKRVNRDMARFDINDPEGRDELATYLEIASEWWAANPGRIDPRAATEIADMLPPSARQGQGVAADALLAAASALREIG